MNNSPKNDKKFSRRHVLPFLWGGIIVPFFGFGKTRPDRVDGNAKEKVEAYQTLLKPDGSVVKVREGAIKRAKVVKNNISNSSLFNWLNKKL